MPDELTSPKFASGAPAPGARAATALALIAAVALYALTIHFNNRKYLSLDVTHFDLQHVTHYYNTIRQGGFGNLYEKDPYLFFATFQEPSNLLAIAAWRIYPHPRALFALQGLYLCVAVFLAYLVLLRLTRRPWASFAATVALAANPYLWTLFTFGFRPSLFAAPCVVGFVLAQRHGRTKLAATLLVLAGLGKVTMMLSVAFTGLLFWVMAPRQRWGMGVFFAALFLFVSLGSVMGYIASRANLTITTEMLHIALYGEDVGQAIATIFTRPIHTIAQMLSPANLAHVVLLGSLLFLPAAAGRYFWGALPDIGLILMSTTSMIHGQYFQNAYPAVFHPLVFLHNNHLFIVGFLMAGFAVGAARIINAAARRGEARAWQAAVAVLVAGIAVRVLWPTMIAGPIPGNIHFDDRYYDMTEHDRLGWEVAALIPRHASLRAQWNLYPPAVGRRADQRAFEWNLDKVREAYIFVDLFAFEYLRDRSAYLDAVEMVNDRADYGATIFVDGYIVWRLGEPTEMNGEVRSFLREHRDELMKNHYRAYRDAFLPEPRVGVDVYSQTQIERAVSRPPGASGPET